MDTTQDHTISRRKQKKAAAKLKGVEFSTETAATIRNSRARRLHHIMKRPESGGLSAKGGGQLRQLFSNKVPGSEERKLLEVDASAAILLLQMAVEGTDAQDLSCEELKQVAEETMTTDGPKDGKEEGGEEDGKAAEDMETEDFSKIEKEEEAGEEQGGVALAKDW